MRILLLLIPSFTLVIAIAIVVTAMQYPNEYTLQQLALFIVMAIVVGVPAVGLIITRTIVNSG